MHPVPANEAERIAAVKSYEILDTTPEKEYDELTAIASAICQTPVSLITLLDDTRQWFKSHHGVALTETPREHAFCAHAIMSPEEVMVVPDSRIDDRFKDNPLVLGTPPVIFYAGAPLLTQQGFPLGSLCVIDTKPRQLAQWQLDALSTLGKHVVRLMDMRKKERVAARMQKLLEQRIEELQKANSLSTIAVALDSLLQDCEEGRMPDAQIIKDLRSKVDAMQQELYS